MRSERSGVMKMLSAETHSLRWSRAKVAGRSASRYHDPYVPAPPRKHGVRVAPIPAGDHCGPTLDGQTLRR